MGFEPQSQIQSRMSYPLGQLDILTKVYHTGKVFMKMILSSVGFEPTHTLGVAELKSHTLDRSALQTMKKLQSS